MTKTKAKKAKPEKKASITPQPWISMRSGIRAIVVASLGMAVLTSWEVVPQRGWLEGILWGLFFGVTIWVIFFGMYWFNRWMHR